MSVKRKISGRKIIQALLTMVLAGVCVFAVMSATKTQSSRKLSGIDIQIKNNEYGFITKEQVQEMLLNDRNVDIGKTSLEQVNVKKMEEVIMNNEWVEHAQVYIDNKRNLHALVTQRVPVVRIFEKDGTTSYYLDRNKERLSLSPQYNYYTTVVTNVPDLSDSANEDVKEQIMAFTKFIRQDTFWNAQVSQLVVGDDKRFEIVPVLGEHRIIMGDTTHLKKKFDNLMAFYNKVLNEVGWNRYEVLDLSYEGQLVASPGLKWKMPEDKVINRINWVNSILGETPVRHAAPKPSLTAAVKQPEVKANANTETVVATPPLAPVENKPKPEAAPASVQKPVVEKKVEKKPAPAKKVAEQPKKQKPVEQVKKTEVKQEERKPKYIYGGQ